MKLRANAVIGGLLVGTVGLMALVSIFWTPYDPLGLRLRMRLQAPSAQFLLGTDEFGRDVLSRLLAGAGTSMLVAGMTVLVALVLGVVIGLIAGYARGWVDRILMVFNDALLSEAYGCPIRTNATPAPGTPYLLPHLLRLLPHASRRDRRIFASLLS